MTDSGEHRARDPSVQTPVALILYNRPGLTRRVAERIKAAVPPRLFLVADGPKPGDREDERRCRRARHAADELDWTCPVDRAYAEKNLGCRRRVETGLDWVFEQVPEAIVLEDDCLPEPTFFPYCDSLLERYRGDSRLMTVAGTNFQADVNRSRYSYRFSRYMRTEGWATWRSAWRHYQSDMRQWPEVRRDGRLRDLLPSRRAERYWTRIFDQVAREERDSWGYVWQFSIWAQGGLTAVPEQNLIHNLGWGEEATHTKDPDHPLAGTPTEALDLPVRHPPYMIRDTRADLWTEKQLFSGSLLRDVRNVLRSRLYPVWSSAVEAVSIREGGAKP